MLQKNQKALPGRRQFLIRNLLRGFAWLLIIVVGYVISRKYFNLGLEDILGSVYDRPRIVYLIFLVSELVFGIIPPEFFMIWSLRSEVLTTYINNIIALSFISYLAGIIGFLIGQFLNYTQFYKEMKKRVFGKFERHLNNYGGFLVVVAALTPIPFSGIAMLVGSIKYPLRNYLWFSVFRFVRFLVYSIIIWKANIL